nr:hypothetical protein [Tanacetum cinerariifolium]
MNLVEVNSVHTYYSVLSTGKEEFSSRGDSPTLLERTTVETLLNMSPENKDPYQSEKEAIHLLLSGIGDEIYSTVDACKIAHDMWIAIEKLQQGESLNIQDVKTNLFWEFGKFTSHDEESMESHYSRFYKMINEMFRNQRIVAIDSARETVGSHVVQQTGIQCFNYKYPKRVKDYTYHTEKMLLCKQAKKDSGTDTEPLEKVQYDSGYKVFANERQHYEQPESINNTCVVEKVDSNVIPDSSDMCDNDIQTDQNAKECDDERVALANLITNLKLNIDEKRFKSN